MFVPIININTKNKGYGKFDPIISPGWDTTIDKIEDELEVSRRHVAEIRRFVRER